MATASLRLIPRRWLRLPARNARLRLTLMYSAMFLVLGTLVVVVIFGVASTGAVGGSSSMAVQAVPGPASSTIHTAQSQQHSADVNRLLAVSWLTLALTAGASALLGWFLAGRVLRPLGQMADAARTITATSLHERLRLEGPDDEFKQLGDTIDELLGRLETSFAAQRCFVANAAHELRTPLTVERTLLQVALADPNLSAAGLRATCEELLAAGRDQERLLDALLTLATSQRGLERRERVDLDALVGDALGSAKAAAEERRLQLLPSFGGAAVRGDPTLLGRLVANLIENAIAYNRPGGTVEVETGARSGRAYISVANTGPVVPADQAERLFEPFRRLGRDRTASDGGHGLGLSIVRAITEAHDADLSAEPGPDGGLIVITSFPPDPATGQPK